MHLVGVLGWHSWKSWSGDKGTAVVFPWHFSENEKLKQSFTPAVLGSLQPGPLNHASLWKLGSCPKSTKILWQQNKCKELDHRRKKRNQSWKRNPNQTQLQIYPKNPSATTKVFDWQRLYLAPMLSLPSHSHSERDFSTGKPVGKGQQCLPAIALALSIPISKGFSHAEPLSWYGYMEGAGINTSFWGPWSWDQGCKLWKTKLSLHVLRACGGFSPILLWTGYFFYNQSPSHVDKWRVFENLTERKKFKKKRKEKASHLFEKLLHRPTTSFLSSTLLPCLSAHCLAALFPVQLPSPMLGPVTLYKVKWLQKSGKQVSAWAVCSRGTDPAQELGLGCCAGASLSISPTRAKNTRLDWWRRQKYIFPEVN